MKTQMKRRKYDEDQGSMSDSCVCSSRNKELWDSGFPPGITVDELKLYCKKKATDYPKDNLHLLEGSFKDVLSEYRRCFKNYWIISGSADVLNKENIPQYAFREKRKVPESFKNIEGPIDSKSEYKFSFVDYFEIGKVKRGNTMENGDKIVNSEKSVFQNQLENHRHSSRWRFLKKNTNLQLEGEHYLQTEKAAKYVPFPLERRPALLKREAVLKLEGDMEKKTETGEQYSLIQLQERPHLCKKDTNLHLEGDLQLVSETREKYVPTQLQPRRKLKKKNSNLHLDGDIELLPEYRQIFVEHKCERPRKILPVNNLTTEGDYNHRTEHSSRFTEHQVIHPIIPHLRESPSRKELQLGDDDVVRKPEYRSNYVIHEDAERRTPTRPKVNLRQEGEIDTKTESQLQFVEKQIPKRERKRSTSNIILEASDRNLPLPERRKPSQAHLMDDIKMEGGIDFKPEYKTSYVDFPRQRPSLKKPQANLSTEGNLSLQTEKSEKYVSHPNVPRVLPIRRKGELSLEGPIECQPEYRRAYQDYLIRERVERKPRPFDNLGTQSAAQKVPSDRKNENLQVPSPSSDKSKSTQQQSTLSRVEAQAFGPEVSNTQKPKSPKLKAPKAKNKKTTISKSSPQLPVGKRVAKKITPPKIFDKFIEVPDLAYQDPYRSPISSLIHSPKNVSPKRQLPKRSLSKKITLPQKNTTSKQLSSGNISPKFLTPQNKSMSSSKAGSLKNLPCRSNSPKVQQCKNNQLEYLQQPSKTSSRIVSSSPKIDFSDDMSSFVDCPRSLSRINSPPRLLLSKYDSYESLRSNNSSPRILPTKTRSPRPLSPSNVPSGLVSPRARFLSIENDSLEDLRCKNTTNDCSPGNLSPNGESLWSPGNNQRRFLPAGENCPRFLSPNSESSGCLSSTNVQPRVSSPKHDLSGFLTPKMLSSKNSAHGYLSPGDLSPKFQSPRSTSPEIVEYSLPRFANERFIEDVAESQKSCGNNENSISFIVLKDDVNNNVCCDQKENEINFSDNGNVHTSWDSASR